ncbi:ribose-phosphate diphosphokinase [[Mycoplasma] testudinis]|uniref:ribose-phosphate diphosphokinase n=1 Tax=[Mycoplasma] testudinis TaxID=33924 RepID=UPI000A0240F1|nr:ribose-phosphate diphosphokinase [[Mycoplasma] testudinis]
MPQLFCKYPAEYCKQHHTHFLNNHIIFGLSASKDLTEKTCKLLKVSPGDICVNRFADGEIYVRSDISIRNKDVIVIQSTSNPVNDNLMELLIAIDSFKRASAKSITVLMPYYGYARQDRKARGREPISAKLVADLLMTAGASRIALTDIHSEQAQGFFSVPVDTLRATQVLLCHLLLDYEPKDLTIVSPDYGGVKRARRIAEDLNLPLAIIDKRRPKPNVAESINVLGTVKDQTCVIVDDMIDTGGTILSASKLLKKKGAKKVAIVATHGLFNGNAIANFKEAAAKKMIDKLYVTDTIAPRLELKQISNLEIVSLDIFYAKILHSYIHGASISAIYGEYDKWIKSPNLKKIVADLSKNR